jgi:replication factor A1
MSELEGLISILVRKSGISASEVLTKIEEKKESLGHLINDDVAVRLVARDLGIAISEGGPSKPIVKIEDLVANINNITINLTIERSGTIREFTKRDGTTGRLAKLIVSDDTGSAALVLWDDKTTYSQRLRVGAKVSVYSAYTKAGLNGEVEVHMGNRSRLEIIDEGPANGSLDEDNTYRGRILRVFDPISFKRKDGRAGRAVAFQITNSMGVKRVLVWNPSDALIAELTAGAAIEISGGVMKTDINGAEELHVNDESSIRIDREDVDPPQIEAMRLADIQPDMSELTVEGIIEGEFDLSTTYSGKTYTRVLLRDGEAALPVIFWNDKALMIKRIAKAGAILRIEGCYTKIGPQGLEINVNKWSRTRAE